MDPNQTTPHEALPPTPETVPAPIEPAVAPQEAPEAAQPQLSHMLIGGIFLAISITSGMALVSAFLPPLRSDQPTTQVASAEVAKPDPYKDVTLTAKSAFVIDGISGTVLYEKNPDAQLPLASITKVALALVVAEVLGMDETVTISREAVARGGGGLTWGEEWKVRDLIDYLLIASSNTAAEALAEAAEEGLRAKYANAPSEDVTVWRMNLLAQDLGLKATYFLNPTGLDESTTQAGSLGSSKDIAMLFRYAIENNRELFAGTSREHATLGPLNGVKRDIHNTNEALLDIPHIYMGKTGLTDLAGGNLAIAYDAHEGHPIIVVVLGSTQEGRFADVTSLVRTTQSALAVPVSAE